MKKVNVVFDFLRSSIPTKITKGRNVVTEMTDNPNFPNPDIPLGDLNETTNELERRYLAAQNGGKENTVLMHQTEDIWNDLMRKEAKYVDRIADGDEAIIISSGFNASKQPTPAIRPELTAESGTKSGSVLLRRQAVKGAKAYVWQYAINTVPEQEDGWKIAVVTGKASVEINDLIPVTKYWFRVAAVMALETSAYNAPIMYVVV
jgi:hypothetical protein